MSKSIKEGKKIICPSCKMYSAKEYADGKIVCYNTDRLTMCSISCYQVDKALPRRVSLGDGYKCSKPEPKSDKEMEAILEYYEHFIRAL